VRIGLLACGLCLMLLVLPGCKVASPSSNTVETFSGTVAPSGTVTHNFKVSKDGEFSITLTAINPAAVVGIAYGGVNSDGSCGVISANNVTLGRQAFASYLVAANYCVAVYDPGTFTQTEAYTIQVSHS
jgi:hypothetical protein